MPAEMKNREILEVRALLGNPSGLTDDYIRFWIEELGVYGAYRYILRVLTGVLECVR